MIKANVLYPHKDGGNFDMTYYLTKHMPLVKERLGGALKSMSVDEGIAGGAPGSTPPFAVVASLIFDNIADLQSSLGTHAAELMADVPNFTNIEPSMQISEVRM